MWSSASPLRSCGRRRHASRGRRQRCPSSCHGGTWRTSCYSAQGRPSRVAPPSPPPGGTPTSCCQLGAPKEGTS
eukprot:7261734-Pyramimonas_sp.AAC.1